MVQADGTLQGGDELNQCEICIEMGQDDCENCYLGNPCIECDDYDEVKHTCKSDGACWNEVTE